MAHGQTRRKGDGLLLSRAAVEFDGVVGAVLLLREERGAMGDV
jgi:hypothetical protein